MTCSTMGDQSRTAIDAEYGLLPSRCRVLRLAALSRANTFVDGVATRWAMADGRGRASMIQVVARVAPLELSHHRAIPFSACSIMDLASNTALPLHAAPRAPHPRSARVPP